MRQLLADYTEIWVRSEIVPLVDFGDRARAIAGTGLDLLGVPDLEAPEGLITELGSFCEIVSWYGANRPAFRAALGSFCKNARFFPALPPEGGSEHAADFFMKQVGGAGMAMPLISIRGGVSRKSVVIHPFSGGQRKNWPMDRFLELERELTGRGHVVEWAAREDWVRFENLAELATWIAGASVYVGNDSGITHLAAAVGTPVVALFGPTNPTVWGPRGYRVRIVKRKTLDEICVKQVLETVLQQLQPARPKADQEPPGLGAP